MTGESGSSTRDGGELRVSQLSRNEGLVPMDIQSYIATPDYAHDLSATQLVWSQPIITATAGAYVFLLYLAVPALLRVRSGNGLPARSALDGERERLFLMNMTGCITNDEWSGGIQNPRVQRAAYLLGVHHLQFRGMQPNYLNFIGTAVALAPLEVRTAFQIRVDAALRHKYWRYMSRAMSLLSADIGDEPSARDRCLAFIEAHAAPSDEGSRLYASLHSCHPRYTEEAILLLPTQAQRVIGEFVKCGMR